MKKLFVCCIMLLAALPGCNDGGGQRQAASRLLPQAQPQSEVTGGIAEFFPFKENTLFSYSGASLTSNSRFYFNHIQGTRAQRLVTVADVLYATEVLQLVGGELLLIYDDAGYHFYENILDTAPNVNAVILKEPLILGHSWQMNEHTTREITSTNTIVETPLGTFAALQITINSPGYPPMREYYARGIGLIKSVHIENGIETESLLTEMTSGTGMQVRARFYFPNVVRGILEEYPGTLSIRTNAGFETQFEQAMRQTMSEEGMPLITENTRINAIRIDRRADNALIDLSREFITEFNIGDGVLISVLQGIANTIGSFYDVRTVIITIDGQLFERGSVRLLPGQGFSVGS